MIKYFFLVCGFSPLFVFITNVSFITLGFINYILLFISFIFDVRKYGVSLYPSSKFYPLFLMAFILIINIIIRDYDVKLVISYLILFIAVLYPKNDSIKSYNFLVSGGVITTLIGFYLYYNDIILLKSEFFDENPGIYFDNGSYRLIGTLSNPNSMAYYLVIITYVNIKYGFNYLYKFLINFIFGICIILTGSRTGIFCYLLLMLFNYNKFILISILSLIVFTTFYNIEYILYMYDLSIGDPRWLYISNFLNEITLENFLLGFGFSDQSRDVIKFSDNLFVEMVMNGGFLFCIAYILLLCHSTSLLLAFIMFFISFFSSSINFHPFSFIILYYIFSKNEKNCNSYSLR